MGNACEAQKARPLSSVHAITRELWNIFKLMGNIILLETK
jgi:hypothetical protein